MRYLADLLDQHSAEPWPTGVEGGSTCGRVDPVMVDADIYGWALGIASGGRLEPDDRERLERARRDLALSLADIPDDGRAYFTRLIRIADVALLGCAKQPVTELKGLSGDGLDVARVDCNGEIS